MPTYFVFILIMMWDVFFVAEYFINRNTQMNVSRYGFFGIMGVLMHVIFISERASESAMWMKAMISFMAIIWMLVTLASFVKLGFFSNRNQSDVQK